MNKKNDIGIVLLAAGNASRMGHNKLKFVVGDKTMLENITKAAVDSMASKVLIVLGANELENRHLFSATGIDVIVNEDWEKGIGSSIKLGLKSIIESYPSLNAVIISVCDQPYLTSQIFNGLIESYLSSNKKIVASFYNNSLGVPVLYDKSLFDELLSIPDEHGAKKYIVDKATEDILESVAFPKGEIDIDTIDDIKKLTLP